MARLPRLSLPGYTHHVIQRGNNGQAIFSGPDDCALLLSHLDEAARKLGVAVHAYVLLPNRFHLLATPAGEQDMAQLMQAVGRRYVRYFNQSQTRTGTLWEGRYRSTLIQPERWLLPCMVELDLLPVRAGLATEPQAHAWSSHRHYTGSAIDRLVTPHPVYWALGNTPFSREAAYAELVRAGIAPEVQRQIGDAALHGWALGDQAFLDELQKRTARRVVRGRAGRPPKAAAAQA
ncbi:MAG TPA: transposase [Ramlibacter sp.]|nr:transposase [Ramlibacter sp.]